MTTRLVGPLSSGAAVGGDGVATANADSTKKIAGILHAFYVEYIGSPPAATTDVVIATKGTNAPILTLVTIADAATDGWFLPRKQICGVDGAAIASLYDRMAIDDLVNVNIAQANVGDSVNVWLLLEE